MLEINAMNSLEVEIEPKPASVERGLSGATKVMNSSEVGIETNLPAEETSEATKVMRQYDKDGDGKFSKDEVHAMAANFIKEKKTRRLATKAAIAMGVLILLVVGLNAGLTAAIVFLSKDVKVVGGVLVDPSTNEKLLIGSADTKVASDGILRDRVSNRAVATASALQELAIDSRLPDSAWDELKYIDVRNDNGGSVHLFVQAFTRIPSTNALHGSFVKIHSTIGTITLDGDLTTFSDNLTSTKFPPSMVGTRPTTRPRSSPQSSMQMPRCCTHAPTETPTCAIRLTYQQDLSLCSRTSCGPCLESTCGLI